MILECYINYLHKRRILVFVFWCFLAANTLQAKQIVISMHYNNTSLKTILNSIESKTKLVFIYNNETIDNNRLYNLNVEKGSIENILKELFIGSGIEFKIVDYYVFLSELKKQNLIRNKQLSLTVEGNVVDENHQSLPGVSIINSENILKSVTDNNGNFKFLASNSDSVITFHMIGFAKQKVKIRSSNFEVVLRNNSILLNELLVVGYGSLKTKEITGSVVSLKTESFSKSIGGDITTNFQGNVSGVYASNDRLRVRGVSSINSSSDPFIVVDGVPQSILLKDLNPDDIESVEVLKDAASAAIYGSRAANGVILVSTKTGKLNTALKATLNFKSGLNFIVNEPDYLKGNALIQVLDDAYYNKYPDRKLLAESDPTHYFPLSSDYTGFNGYNRTWLNNYLNGQPNGENWMDAVSQPMRYNDLRLSLSGGQSQSKYLVSFSYRKNDDFIKEKSSDRMTLLIKNEYNLTPWLSFGMTSSSVLNLANNSNYPSIIQVLSRSSLLPVYAPDNSGKLFDARNINEKKGTNPLYQMQETWDDNLELNQLISSFVNIKINNELNLRTDWSVNFGTRRYRYYQSKDYYRENEAIDPSKSGIILYARTLNYGFNGNNVLTYKSDFSDTHRFKLMLGNNIQSFNSDFNVARFEGFPTDYFQLTNANTEKVYTKQSAGMDGFRFLSFFTRAQYSFSEKWFAEINARADGTSRFNPKNRWGYFPGLGLSWLMSDEPFLKEIQQIDYLKLRTSYGLVGNAEMGNFPAQSRAVNWGEYGGSPGFVFDRIANPDVSWEKQTQLNLGFNLSTFNNRIVVDFDWFYKKSNDLLVNYNIGVFQGYFSTDVTLNTGVMSNKGLDLNLKSNNLTGKLKWQTDFNISTFKTNVLKLSTQQNYIERGVNRVYEGHPLALYFLPLWAGVDPTTGHELIYEVSGIAENRQKTGKVLDAELMDLSSYNNQRVLITDKTPYPDFYGGINNTFNYKNWELSFLVAFQTGNWIYHSGLRQASYINTYDIQNKFNTLANHWTSDNRNSSVPLLFNSQMASRENSRYLVDGSYLRLRNLMLNYTLPEKWAGKLYAKSIRFMLQAQNLFTISNFKNGDPEVSNGSSGADANITPGNIGANFGIMTLNLGVNIEF